MTYMSDEIVLARIMTVWDLEFERALHYHDEGYDSDNDYDLPGPFVRPVHIHLVSMTEASLNPVDCKGQKVPPLHSHQGDPGMSCLSAKQSADD